MDWPRARISFIVPAYNEEKELPATLSQLRSAAEESRCDDYEIVVANDASTDRTAAIAREFGARVIELNRRQIAAARNSGARAANGDVLIFVDADTHIRGAHVQGAVDALSSGCAGGGAPLEFDREVPFWAKLFFAAFTTIYFRFLRLGTGGFLFTSRRNFNHIGGFNEKYFAAEEFFFTLALRRIGHFKLLQCPAKTSGRKLRLYSGGKLLRQLLLIAVCGPRAVTSRRNLDLWYGGERERS